MYHEVTDDPTTTGFQRFGAREYRVTVQRFRTHLSALAESRVTPAALPDFPGNGRPQLFLTFDDGGRSALVAAEALARYGWIGHFFVVTERIGTRGFLDGAAIRELSGKGHVIGTHSHTHPDIFRDLTAAA